MTDELKPVRCGCGGEAVLCESDKYDSFDFTYMIYCKACGISSDVYDTEVDAIMAWNRAMGARTAKVKKGAYDLMRCECGMPVSSNYDYCPKCRARLEWE